MTDEIISGADILGALVMGHPYQSWWCGSDLDIEESRRLVPHQNATTMQVAISVVAACMWMLENPRRGLCVPDDLPHDYVLHVSKLYLGKFISMSSDWNPLKHYSNAFHGYNQPQLDTSDPWQFKNFLITEDRIRDTRTPIEVSVASVSLGGFPAESSRMASSRLSGRVRRLPSLRFFIPRGLL